MNPFIILTTTEGGQTRINVNHIIAYELRAYKKQYGQTEAKTYTYMLLTSNCTREVKETPEDIDEIINHAVLSIPYANIQGV